MKRSQKVKIGLVQMAMGPVPEHNFVHALDKIVQAARGGANIVCLPEVFTTPYFPQEPKKKKFFAWAHKLPGRIGERLAHIARKEKVVLIAGSVFEKAGEKYFNTSLIFDEKGKLLGKYRKLHIPHDPNFYEQHYFSEGNEGYKVFKTRYGNVGVLICYDQWFPEAARATALLGADIIFYPTAIGLMKGERQPEGPFQEAWEAVQRGHAIANAVYVAAVNRVGMEDGMQFWGGSFIYDSFGKLVKRGDAKQGVIMGECDFGLNTFVREGWRFFYNRRIDM